MTIIWKGSSKYTVVQGIQPNRYLRRDEAVASNFTFVDDEIPTGLINGVNTTYTLANTPNPVASLKVFKNGQKLTLTTDYTLSGATLTMIVALESGEKLTVDYRY